MFQEMFIKFVVENEDNSKLWVKVPQIKAFAVQAGYLSSSSGSHRKVGGG